MFEVDFDVVPSLESERAGAFVGAEAEQRLGGDDVAAPTLAACDSLELAQLLERVDPDVRVGADAEPDAAPAHALDRQEAVAEVGFGRRARADARARPRQEIQLGAV